MSIVESFFVIVGAATFGGLLCLALLVHIGNNRK